MKTLYNSYFITISLVASVLFLSARTDASYPAGYYDSLDGKCGSELMRAVKSKVANHNVISYGTDTWDAFRDTDVRTINGTDYWWDMYSNNLVTVASGHPGLNIEHSVANSWWGKTKNDAYKDIVHLNPSDADANSRKGNYPLAELASVTWTNGVTSVGKAKSGQGGGAATCYEPCDEYKGDFARVFMYMFTIYDDISWKSNTAWMYDTSSSLMFKPWASSLLLRWSADDPVSDKERNRNDGIYLNQNNRNPFIDLPDLADHIWGAKANVPFDLNGNDPGPGPNPDPDPDPDPQSDSYRWLQANDPDEGEWTFENVNIPSTASYIWSWKQYNGQGYLNASAYINNSAYESEAYAWSPAVSFANVETAKLSFSHAAKFQTTLRTLCSIVVKDTDSGAVYEVDIPVWPGVGSWSFADCKNIDLSHLSGKNVKIGFKYASSPQGADTWEIRNVNLDLTRIVSGIDSPVAPEEEDDSFLVEVWGRNIVVPDGARIFDLNGRLFDGHDLNPGIYIVVKPTFRSAVKVLVK